MNATSANGTLESLEVFGEEDVLLWDGNATAGPPLENLTWSPADNRSGEEDPTPDGYYMDEGWLRHSICVTAIYCLAYSTVFVLGIFGNYFVVAVVLRTPRMRTVTNYFIVNLALADILVIIFCLPATLLSNILSPWVLGRLMCKSVTYVQGLSVAASVYSLVAVSLDRFLAICYPLRCQITKSRAKIIIVVTWIVSLIIPIPWALYFDLDLMSEHYPDLYVCKEMWPSVEAEKLHFVVANLMLNYILPLLVIAYCYIMIWLKVWSRNVIGETKGGQMNLMIQKSKVKVIEMLVVVIVLFMLSWLPLYIIFVRMKFGGEPVPGSLDEYMLAIVVPIAQWLGSSNSCINPIMYAFFNDKYRKGFVAIIKSRRCCGKLVSQYDDMCSTIRQNDFQKSRHWRETQTDFVSSSGV